MEWADTLGRAGKLATMLGRLNTLAQAVIGRGAGQCLWRRCCMASVCDVGDRVDTLKMALPRARLGSFQRQSPYVWREWAKAGARVFMSARLLMRRAIDLGLLARAVPTMKTGRANRGQLVPLSVLCPGLGCPAKQLCAGIWGPRIDSQGRGKHTIAHWRPLETRSSGGISAPFTTARLVDHGGDPC